jgi:hypothetical protein
MGNRAIAAIALPGLAGLGVIGIVLQFLSPWTAPLLAVQIAFQLRRCTTKNGC